MSTSLRVTSMSFTSTGQCRKILTLYFFLQEFGGCEPSRSVRKSTQCVSMLMLDLEGGTWNPEARHDTDVEIMPARDSAAISMGDLVLVSCVMLHASISRCADSTHYSSVPWPNSPASFFDEKKEERQLRCPRSVGSQSFSDPSRSLGR